jgi:hypothetical protein
MIHRPVSAGSSGAHIWLSFSPTSSTGATTTSCSHARRGAWWDANKIGLSPSPAGDLGGLADPLPRCAAHRGGCLYRLGLALLDLEDPRRVLRAAMIGSSRRSYPTNATAMWTTSCSPAAGSSTRRPASSGVLRRRGHLHRAGHGPGLRSARLSAYMPRCQREGQA